MKADILVDAKCTLAEGIQWREDQQRLWWTDIHGCVLWSCDADGSEISRWDTPERLGSFVFDPDGHLLCAFESGLFKWDLNRDRLQRITDFEPTHPTSRLNDGRCDRQGRFVAGGVDENGLKASSSVIRHSPERTENLLQGNGCANSICFSPDGAWMYFADTPTRQIMRYPYGDELGQPTTFFADERLAGMPDGSCIDADGAVWNARFNGSAVQQILPNGKMGAHVSIAAPQVTCACFGGPDPGSLYITTARENMSEDQVAMHPLSGGVFAVRPGATGLPETRYAERLFPS